MNSLLNKLMLPVTGVLALGFLLLAIYIPSAIKQNSIEQVVKNSVSTTVQFKTLRGYYTKNVVGAAKKFGMTPHFEYKGKDGYFPLPATMVHEVTESLRAKGTEVNLYSPYPFPNRASRSLSSSQNSAWTFLNKFPSKTYVEEIEKGGKPFLRVAISDTMQAQGCVNCHNAHPDTPKADWKLNDVRGVLEVVTPLEEVNEVSTSLSIKVVSILVLALVVALAAMTYLFRILVRVPLKEVERSLKAIASGEADLNRKLPVKSSDELGRISESFNLFMDKLKDIVVNLVSVSDNLRQHAHELNTMTSGVANSAVNQMSESEMLATAVNEMTVSISEIQTNSQHASERIQKVTENVDASNEATKQNVSAIHTLSSDVSQVVNVITELQEESNNIGSVLDVIKAIAEQTNLLALNAAIEAARAGEQGRGFAVVADEVRALAGRTQESTVEIQATVEKLQERARSATQVIEESSKHTSNCVELSDEVSDMLNKAHVQVDELEGLTTQITTSINEQSNVTSEIDQNVVRVNDAAQHIKGELGNLKSLTENLDQIANEISVELGKFKV